MTVARNSLAEFDQTHVPTECLSCNGDNEDNHSFDGEVIIEQVGRSNSVWSDLTNFVLC